MAKQDKSYGWLGVDMPRDIALRMAMIQRMIKKEDLYEDKGGFGLEKNPHVTLAYGHEEDEPTSVKEAIKDLGAGEGSLSGMSLFDTNPDYKVLKFDVDSEHLRGLNSRIQERIPMPGSTFKDYNPHVTVAYLKKDADIEKYQKLERLLKGRKFPVKMIRWSNPKDQYRTLLLDGVLGKPRSLAKPITEPSVAPETLSQENTMKTPRLSKIAEIILDINVGDTVLVGRFKNKPVTVQNIGTDENGQPTINGRKLLSLRIKKLMPKKTKAATAAAAAKKLKKKAAEGTDEAPKGKTWAVRWAGHRAIVNFRKKSDAQTFYDSGAGHSGFEGTPPKLMDAKKGWKVRNKSTTYGCDGDGCKKCGHKKKADYAEQMNKAAEGLEATLPLDERMETLRKNAELNKQGNIFTTLVKGLQERVQSDYDKRTRDYGASVAPGKYHGLDMPKSFKTDLKSNRERIKSIVNGMGSPKTWWYATHPDSMYGMDVTPVSDIHDYEYTYPGKPFETEEEATEYRDAADERFHGNLKKLIDIHSTKVTKAEGIDDKRRAMAADYLRMLRYAGPDTFMKLHPIGQEATDKLPS